ncbi:MAG: peptide chain release factor 1 [Aggregatilineales bacterium]
MLERLADVESRYQELERLLADPEVAMDYQKVAEYAKERSDLMDIVAAYRSYQRQTEELGEAKDLLSETNDEEMKELAELEISELQDNTEQLLEDLKMMLLPKDPRDGKNAIVEIRPAAGGDEAGIFANDLYRMYLRYAAVQGWKTEVMSLNESGGDVLKYVSFIVKGAGVFSRMKYESGVHRVQRVPATESQGRVHTSTASVAVLAEMDEVEVNLNMNDVKEEFFRSQGAGGQSVNTTDSAVRLTHLPTGLVVEMQDERKQLQNRNRAKQVLAAKLYELEMQKQRDEQDEERRGQIGSGDRSEKIRTYNYPQNRVTDHRVNHSNYNLPGIMDGSLDEFIDRLATQEQADLLAHSGV